MSRPKIPTVPPNTKERNKKETSKRKRKPKQEINLYACNRHEVSRFPTRYPKSRVLHERRATIEQSLYLESLSYTRRLNRSLVAIRHVVISPLLGIHEYGTTFFLSTLSTAGPNARLLIYVVEKRKVLLIPRGSHHQVLAKRIGAIGVPTARHALEIAWRKTGEVVVEFQVIRLVVGLGHDG